MQMIALGIEFMDLQHQQFVETLRSLKEEPDEKILETFPLIVTALTEHFSQEEALMQQCGFGALQEHRGEHQRLLGECAMLTRFAKRGGAGSIITFLTAELPKWFDTHLQTMDAALARHALDHPL
ncbi:bacteriohemerythrin [Magnetococcus sp. PR-3]|uniref:bacteriohemerythrin n=1 Tax=Magnetococcus sp. PR-3 TaxID=3120355 RepID=UPI002FCE4369